MTDIVMDGKCLFNSVSQSNSLTMKDKLGERAIDLHKQTNKQVLYEVQEGNNINPINPPLGNDIIAHCDNFNSPLFPMNFWVI